MGSLRIGCSIGWVVGEIWDDRPPWTIRWSQERATSTASSCLPKLWLRSAHSQESQRHRRGYGSLSEHARGICDARPSPAVSHPLCSALVVVAFGWAVIYPSPTVEALPSESASLRVRLASLDHCWERDCSSCDQCTVSCGKEEGENSQRLDRRRSRLTVSLRIRDYWLTQSVELYSACSTPAEQSLHRAATATCIAFVLSSPLGYFQTCWPAGALHITLHVGFHHNLLHVAGGAHQRRALFILSASSDEQKLLGRDAWDLESPKPFLLARAGLC